MHWRGLVSLLVALGLSACLGPNPRLESGNDETESGATGDGDPSGDGDGDPSGDGDGDGEPSGDGDGDGEPSGDGDGDDDPCQNGVLDGDETDLDCGGSCSPCATDQMCADGQDCVSLICTEGLCVAPSCSDEVQNGNELEVDCGGNCRFCEHSAFIPQLSDTTEGLLLQLGTAMFEDGGFALAYLDYNFGARVRWFNQSAEALGPATAATPEISESNFDTLSLCAGAPDAVDLVHLAVNGNDPMSDNIDAFAAALDSGDNYGYQPIYQGPENVTDAALDVEDEIGAFVWSEAGEVHLRRHDFAMGVDLGAPLTANPEFALRPAEYPMVATRDGLTVVAWVVCDAMDDDACDIELRRYDGGWLDNAPVVLGLPVGSYFTPQLAIAADGRVAVTAWNRDQDNDAHAYAAIFDADWNLEGWWLLQGDLVSAFTPSPVVAALSDGSFAFAWSDPGDERIHVRRFINADVPLVEDVGDEAPWPGAEEAAWVSLATSGNRLVVAWTALLDGTYVAQGQVLSF